MEKTIENCIRECANVTLINRGIKTINNYGDMIDKASKILSLAGNPTRLKILILIKTEKKICVCDLSDILGISISAISQQLRRLKDNKLLKSNKEGQTIYYHIHPDAEKILDHIFEIFNHKSIKKVA